MIDHSTQNNEVEQGPKTSATSVRGLGLGQALPFQRLQSMRYLGSSSTIESNTEIPSTISIPSTKSLDDHNRKRALDTDVDISPSLAPLHSKLAGDVGVALLVTFGVSPFLTVVDKAIVESANGTKPILSSARDSITAIVRHPMQYVKSPTFLLMWAVYGATYSTANSFKTLEEHQSHSKTLIADKSAASSVAPEVGKMGTFLGTTFVNSGTSIVKDRAYARMFSTAATNTTSSTATSFPKTTYAMWMMRDLNVIGSSFILPDMVSQNLIENYGMEASQAQSLCQLTIPVAAQFVAGPFHFLGLDFFNRQHHPSVRMSLAEKAMDRSRALYEGIGPVVAARIARIAPGYGIGGVWNTKLRTAWRESLVQRVNDKDDRRLTNQGVAPRILSVLNGGKVGRNVA